VTKLSTLTQQLQKNRIPLYVK